MVERIRKGHDVMTSFLVSMFQVGYNQSEASIDVTWSVSTNQRPVFMSLDLFGPITSHYLFQFAYTTVFGMYSAFLFIKTGHFAAPFIVHAYCNFMGFPDFMEVCVICVVIFLAAPSGAQGISICLS